MTTLIKYAIRRKSDGFYIPQPQGRNGRGGSRVEPIDPSNSFENIRLFHNESAAKIALNAWLKGEWITKRTSGDYFGGIEPEEEIEIYPVASRVKDDMEVVPVEVVLPSKTKPVWHLTGAVFIGSCLWGDPVEPEHPHYHPPGSDKHARTSRILYRTDDNTFETRNSIYIVKEWVPNGRSTIPLDLTRKPEDAT